MAYSVQIYGHFVQMFWDMDLKFFLPVIYFNFNIQTNFEVNRAQIGYFIPKITKMAISQNPILPKCHSPKSLLLLHFSMNFSETFRMYVNMYFANTSSGRFLFGICEIYIYIDSESFRKIHWKNN